jgi:hypothetical protein
MHDPKNVKKRNWFNKYISVILTNTISTVKQRKAFKDSNCEVLLLNVAEEVSTD